MKDQDIQSIGDMVRRLGMMPFDPKPVGVIFRQESDAEIAARVVEWHLRQQQKDYEGRVAALQGEFYQLSCHLAEANATMSKLSRLIGEAVRVPHKGE